MKKGFRQDDPFREQIKNLLLKYSGGNKEGSFRTTILAEIQDHSKEIQNSEHSSDFFFRLCELVVDCQSLSVSDDSFKIVVARLLSEFSDTIVAQDDELRNFIGMDAGRFEAAKEKLKDRECISLLLDKKKKGKKGAIVSWKKSRSEPVEVDVWAKQEGFVSKEARWPTPASLGYSDHELVPVQGQRSLPAVQNYNIPEALPYLNSALDNRQAGKRLPIIEPRWSIEEQKGKYKSNFACLA